MDTLNFLLPALVMSFLLVGIHCYLGIHVLMRGVIFVDLSLAQVAALGSVVALAFGVDHEDPRAYFLSLGMTLVASVFLAVANTVKKLSQEAIIGIIYAFSSALVVLIVDRLSHGAEHIKHALIGQLLWVTWEDVVKTAVIYSVVGVVHYLIRKRMFEVSEGKVHSWKMDLLFYGLFGVVITSSVYVAGVLIVFAFLVVPSIISSLFFTSIKLRLLFGWAMGFIVSALAIFGSHHFDLPSGPLLVCMLTVIPILMILMLKMIQIRAPRN